MFAENFSSRQHYVPFNLKKILTCACSQKVFYVRKVKISAINCGAEIHPTKEIVIFVPLWQKVSFDRFKSLRNTVVIFLRFWLFCFSLPIGLSFLPFFLAWRNVYTAC